MIYHLFYPLAEIFSVFNVTRYITFRSGCAFVTSFIIVFLLWKLTLKYLKRLKIIEKIDMYGHVHLESLYGGKKGTPTMGGVLIIFSILISVIIWMRWDNYFLWLSLIVMLSLGLLGLYDDLLKIKKNRGLSRSRKLFWQCLIGFCLGILIVVNKNLYTYWNLPFLKKVVIDLGYFYVFWSALMIAATSNAVNFTDGLDGLAIGAIILNSFIFGVLSYIVGHIKFADYLFIPHIKEAAELSVLCFAMMGASLAFLWFNAYPAEIFMGNTGALALGGVIGAVALLIKQEFLLFISGGLFVAESLSVILQIFSVKIRKKRLFKAAPLHHHFQVLGWAESKVTIRFWIISIICAVLTLLTLKLR
ncbi:MAG: phospho-N-acetylmuramoyl-pentapeptide-transferase [Candidatus Omnitrophica bacterium]|jgi:phospho-N-acetylmuramoyl-pentapeptide-transferase|nr:phospho-N-acetylmuramoyl-pentapeptide-transferase [Candidatus Omnitrophota bacterium]